MLTTVVKGSVLRDLKGLNNRFEVLQNFLHSLPKDLNVIALPAGYFYVANLEELHRLASRLKEIPKTKETALLVGVDLGTQSNNVETPDEPPAKTSKPQPKTDSKAGAKKKNSLGKRSQNPKLSNSMTSKGLVEGHQNQTHNYPFYAIACIPGEEKPRIYHQISVSGSERGAGTFTSEGRFFNVGELEICVLLCGELFNKDIRRIVVGEKPSLVLDLAHSAGSIEGGRGSFRGHAGMRVLAKFNIPSLLSVHARGEGSFQGWAPSPAGPVRLTNKEIDHQHKIIKAHRWSSDKFIT